MDSVRNYGLPKLVCDLLRTQELEEGVTLSYKVVNSGQFTQLVLTWRPDMDINRTHVHEGHAHGNQIQNLGKIPGFRRKSPCEIRRDKLRKEQYLLKKRNSKENGTKNKKNAKTVSTSIQCNMGKGVITRSMARQDNVEKPRYDEQFNTSSASLLCSPETVSCGLSDGSPGSVMTPPVPISPVHQGLVNASLHSPTCDMDYVTSQTSVTSTPVSEGTSDLEEVPPGGDNHEKHVKNSMTSSEIKTTLANIQRDFDSKFEHLFKQYGVK